MSRIAYVNGRYVPHRDASVHIEDRGYQFADGVYEVCEVHSGDIIDLDPHLERLERSLRELRMAAPMSRACLPGILQEVIGRNRVRDGIVYVQVTRGVAPRDHAFPKSGISSLVITAKSMDRRSGDAKRGRGARVVTVPETRWARVDIKSIGLLPNVIARQTAIEAGADEAWFVDGEGHVLEGAATNAWIVTGSTIVTRSAERGILRGITRATVMKAATSMQMTVEERAFTVAEAQSADEAFMTAASTLVMPVIAIDGTAVGTGGPGPVTSRLRDAFHDVAERTAA